MHREFDAAENPFRQRSNLTVYLFTGLLAGLLVADLWPALARWLSTVGVVVPSWTSRELFGFRYSLIAAVLGGARVLFTSLEKLPEGKVGADLALAIACVAAILSEKYLVAAEVVFIGMVGECLEAITFDRTQRALGKLTELFPHRCWVLREGKEVRLLTADLTLGDLVVIKPGGRIPVDGVVVAGSSSVNTSALTGESLPVTKSVDDAVLAGSIVTDGTLTVHASKLSKQTVAGQVIELTATALKDKSPGERQADRLARFFLPAVLALALFTFAFNYYIHAGSTQTNGTRLTTKESREKAQNLALAVLVVACPCPLVLATPAAVIAALGRLAGTGVLIKSSSAIERLASVTGFAFDKTGTLTEGQLELGDLLPLHGTTADELLSTAAVAETKSEHPIARLIVAEAVQRYGTITPPERFLAHPGAGVTATTANGQQIVVGTRRFLVEQNVELPPAIEGLLTQLDESGQTQLLVARDGLVLGTIGARDRLRPEAAGVVASLRELGLKHITLLTGDRAAPANAVAGPLALTAIHAELLPAQKADFLTAEGLGPTAFVGDGINDAPALARATVGIAIAGNTDVAAETGDIVMMGDPLRPITMLIRLCRETVRIIRQNVIWFGFGVNLIGVIFTGWLWPFFSSASSAEWDEKAPLAGAIYHQIGSLAVLLNSMRLLTFERPSTNTLAVRLRSAYQTIDRWINTVHLDDFFHTLAHRWKTVATVLCSTAVVVWLVSGLAIIEANEVGVVQRFGAPVADLAPGLNVRWPWPIESVSRVRPAEVLTVEIGFRLISDDDARRLEKARLEQQKLRRPGRDMSTETGQTWASAHAEGIARKTDESLLITGDDNLIELLATVRYSVSDPRQFLFATKSPEIMIRSTAEAVFRELAAARTFEHMLGTGRSEFERLALTTLIRRLSESSPNSGIRIDGLSVHDLHPPQEVVAAYHSVADAIQRRDKKENEAKAEAVRLVGRAREDALRTTRQATAKKEQKINTATANLKVIRGWIESRTKLPADDEAELVRIAQDQLARGVDPIATGLSIALRRQQFLTQRRFVTDFRLALDAITGGLESRDKQIIDAENTTTTRQLFLYDADFLPRIPPLAFPRGGPPVDQREP